MTFLKNQLTSLIRKADRVKSEIAITFVANIKDKTRGFENYNDFSVDTEFFSEGEADFIIKALRNFGFYVIVYTDEIDFIQDSIIKKNTTTKKHHIVYSTAQKGTGPGRKGLVSSFCNLNGVKYCGSNSQVMSLCRHKYHYNKLLLAHKLPVVKSWLYDSKSGWILSQLPPINSKIILKPVYESASIGIDERSVIKVSSFDELNKKAAFLSNKFSQPIIAQNFIPGYEIEIPVISLQGRIFCSDPVGLSLNDTNYLGNSILNYDDVYNDRYGFYDFTKEIKYNPQLLEYAKKAASILGIEGFGRIDFRMRKNGQCYITDVSTSPHIIQHSSFCFAMNHLGLKSEDLPVLLVAVGLEKYGIF